jgi:hypothetical protein
MKQVKKLSVATVYGKIKLSELMTKKEMIVMRVIGSAVAVKKGISSFGEWTALQGKFRASNPSTGEVQESATLFLPDVALIPVQVALSAGAQAVEFAIDVSVKYVAEEEGHKPGGSPYEYSFASLIEPSDDDPIARLEAKLKAALPAPTETPPVQAPKKKAA